MIPERQRPAGVVPATLNGAVAPLLLPDMGSDQWSLVVVEFAFCAQRLREAGLHAVAIDEPNWKDELPIGGSVLLVDAIVQRLAGDIAALGVATCFAWNVPPGYRWPSEFLEHRAAVMGFHVDASDEREVWRACTGNAVIVKAEPTGHPAMRPAPKLPTMLDWLDVAELPAPDWCIEGLLPERSLGVLAGAPASCKSLLVQDWCARMVYGMGWRGRAVKPGSVLYLAGEGFGGLGLRARAWRAQNNAGGTDGRYFAVANGVPVLSTAQGAGELDAMLAALVSRHGHAPALVVVDTLSQAFGDGDENDARTVAPVMRSLGETRTRHGCAVLVIHHLSKPQQGTPTALSLNSVRGSSALVGNVDVVLGVLALDGVQTLKVLKLKDGEAAPPIRSQVLVVETGRTFDNGQPERSAILVPAVAEVTEPERNLNAEADEQVQKIVAALQAMGGRTSSMTTVTKRLKGRKTDLLAAFREAIDRNLIVPMKVEGERFYVVTGGSQSGAGAPPIPPLREPEPRKGSVPLLGAPVPVPDGNQAGTSEPDDGLPEQPKGKRSKRKAVRQ